MKIDKSLFEERYNNLNDEQKQAGIFDKYKGIEEEKHNDLDKRDTNFYAFSK